MKRHSPVPSFLSLCALAAGLMSGAVDASTQTGFLILGDAGTGKPEQYRVAASMRSTCQTLPCQFAIGLGDNIAQALRRICA